jgi:hypothetical protein
VYTGNFVIRPKEARNRLTLTAQVSPRPSTVPSRNADIAENMKPPFTATATATARRSGENS